MTRRSEPPSDDRPVHLLHQVSYRLDEHFAAETAKRGLTQQLAVALSFVRQELPMHELAKCLRCETSNLTGVVDRLEARGLVTRVPDETDRRIKRVVLTRAGRQMLDELMDAFEEFEPIARLSSTDRAHLVRILSRAVKIAEG